MDDKDKEIERLIGKLALGVSMVSELEGDLSIVRNQLARVTALLDRYRLRADRELELGETISSLVKRLDG